MQPVYGEKNWRIPNRLEAVACAAREAFEWVAAFPLSPLAKYSTWLVIEEMTTNMVRHGYDDDQEHPIDIAITADCEQVQIVFEDDGHPFDPSRQSAPDIENVLASIHEGGFGIELVRRLCAKMIYERNGNSNRLVLHIPNLEPSNQQATVHA